MKKGLVVLCAVMLLGAFGINNVVESQPRRLQVDHGCVDTLRVFGIKFASGVTEFISHYLTFKLSGNAAGDCTVKTFYNGSNIGRAGGVIYEAGETYTTPARMFWYADSIYVAKNDTTDLFCWEASRQ